MQTDPFQNTAPAESKPFFTIKHERFEGPLDLLLSLIEKRKLFINEISLSKITDDFISHIQNLQGYPIAESAHFILIASTLVLIKSRSLLPQLKLTEEEEDSIQDLETRLKLYKRIKELSVHVSQRFGKEIMFEPQTRKLNPVFAPDASMTAPNLATAIRSLIASLPKKEKLPEVLVRKVVSLEEMIDTLTSRIKGALKMSFKTFAGVGKEEKVNVIVSFLAMLELVKQGMIQVRQERDFDDIVMETSEVGLPHYGTN